jgi:hypothetical protein
VRRSLAPHAPRPQPSLDDRSTTRSKKVINFVSLGPAQAIAIKIGRGGKMMINAKANFWRCSTSRPCGRASAGLGSRSPGILRRRANCSSPASPGRFGRRSHAHGRSSPSPATEPVLDRANLARPVFGTDRNSAHVKWRRVARMRDLRPIRRDRFAVAGPHQPPARAVARRWPFAVLCARGNTQSPSQPRTKSSASGRRDAAAQGCSPAPTICVRYSSCDRVEHLMPNSLRPGKEHGISRFLDAFRIAAKLRRCSLPGRAGNFCAGAGNSVAEPRREQGIRRIGRERRFC